MTHNRLTGNLATMSLPDLLQWAGRSRKTGTLVLRDGSLAKRISFRDGDIVGSSSNDPRDYLGQVLLSEGVITEQQLKDAMDLQARSKRMLGRILVQWGSVTEAKVVAILRHKAEETVYSLFLWGDADFEFIDGDDPPGEQIAIAVVVEEVLLEGVRRYDTSRKIRELLPNNRLVLKHTERALPADIAGKAFPRKIYDLMDGRRTLADIILEAHSSEYNVCQVLCVLVQRGYAAIVGEARTTPVAAPAPLPATGGMAMPATAAADAAAGATGSPVEQGLATARECLGRGDAEDALLILDALRDAGLKTPEVYALTQEAERYFIERAYRFYLPPGKVPVLKRPLESLVGEALSPEEVFLVSRVNGAWDLRAIMSISPLREVDALRALKKLRERGVIDLVEPAAQAKTA
jgi:hypothetical protein